MTCTRVDIRVRVSWAPIPSLMDTYNPSLRKQNLHSLLQALDLGLETLSLPLGESILAGNPVQLRVAHGHDQLRGEEPQGTVTAIKQKVVDHLSANAVDKPLAGYLVVTPQYVVEVLLNLFGVALVFHETTQLSQVQADRVGRDGIRVAGECDSLDPLGQTIQSGLLEVVVEIVIVCAWTNIALNLNQTACIVDCTIVCRLELWKHRLPNLIAHTIIREDKSHKGFDEAVDNHDGRLDMTIGNVNPFLGLRLKGPSKQGSPEL